MRRLASAKPSRHCRNKSGFDASGILHALDVRERKSDRKQFNVTDVFSRYLAALEQVTAAVDKMLDSGAVGSS